MNDDANSIATIVSTRVLSPRTAVRWGVARDIVIAWALTIPGAATVSALNYFVLGALGAV